MLYVDAATGTAAGTAGLQTEILSFDGERLVNLLEQIGRSSKDTVRRAGLYSRDIDADGVPEIPVQKVFHGYEERAEAEQILRTDWLMMKNDLLYTEHSSYYSTGSGYLFMMPDAWQGNVTVVNDASSGELQFCMYTGDWNAEMPVVLRIYISEDEADTNEHLAAGFHLMHTKGTAEYLVRAEDVEELGISAAELVMCFKFVS